VHGILAARLCHVRSVLELGSAIILIFALLSTAAPFLPAPVDDKIYKIHSSEFRCKLSLRWKMDESSAA
jgi:hypothetical protein